MPVWATSSAPQADAGTSPVYGTDFENVTAADSTHLNMGLKNYFDFGNGNGAKMWVEGLDQHTTGITCHSGSRCIGMELTNINSSRRNDFMVYPQSLVTNQLFVSVWLYLPVNWQLYGPAGDNWYGIVDPFFTGAPTFWPYGALHILQNDPSQQSFDLTFDVRDMTGSYLNYWRTNGYSLPGGRWFNIEYYVLFDTTNGAVKLWIDGSLLFNVSGFPTANPSVPSWFTTVGKIYYNTLNMFSPYRIWVDDLEIYNTQPQSSSTTSSTTTSSTITSTTQTTTTTTMSSTTSSTSSETVFPKAVASNGGAAIDTSQSEFGGASDLFDGTDGYLSVPDSNDWYFGTGDFTIDFWVRFVSPLQAVQGFCGQHNGNALFEFLKSYSTIAFYARLSNGAIVAGYTFGWSPSPNTWYHLALVRSASNVYIFINGVSQTLTVTNPIGTNDLGDIASSFTVGYEHNNNAYLNGWMDEFRVSKGVARWTSNFTPPAAPHVRDSSTVLLLHMDGANGSTTFTDDVSSLLVRRRS